MAKSTEGMARGKSFEKGGFRNGMCASLVWQGLRLKCHQIAASLPMGRLRAIHEARDRDFR